MSVPGLAVLYGGVMQKRWSVNSMTMMFIGFCMTLIVWVLFAYEMGFGHAVAHGGSGVFGAHGFLGTFLGEPVSILGRHGEQYQAEIQSIKTGPPFHFPTSTLAYFQFVFAAITPILALGSVLGRVNWKAWTVYVAAWIPLVYSVNAFLLWGGGYWAAHGAMDFSGGYVIHLSAGVSGFVFAWVLGPRSASRSRGRRAEQPPDGGDRRGSAVARLERLQRRRSLLRGPGRRDSGAEHQPRDRGRADGVDRMGRHLPRQAVDDRLGQRHDHGPCGDHALCAGSSTATARSSSGRSEPRSYGSRSASSAACGPSGLSTTRSA